MGFKTGTLRNIVERERDANLKRRSEAKEKERGERRTNWRISLSLGRRGRRRSRVTCCLMHLAT